MVIVEVFELPRLTTIRFPFITEALGIVIVKGPLGEATITRSASPAVYVVVIATDGHRKPSAAWLRERANSRR